MKVTRYFPTLLALPVFCLQAQSDFSFGEAQQMLTTYCAACHKGKTALAKFDIERYQTLNSVLAEPRRWTTVLNRVRDSAMPPKGSPAPSLELKDKFSNWLDGTLRKSACADGISPGLAFTRRLNRSEYSSTVRDLLNLHVNAGHALPADGAGGEGFDNAVETLFLSPIHAEKYLEAAKTALGYAVKEPRSRKVFLNTAPGAGLTPEQAAEKVLAEFLPRAFRRPVPALEQQKFMDLFRVAQKRGDSYDESVLYAMQAAMISPHFLFRVESANNGREPARLNDFELAARLSYFLWGSMPDKTLSDLAAEGKLQDAAVLREQVARMLKDNKSTEFAESFVEQWLGTRELGRDIKPDKKLFPEYYDEEIASGMRYEPILFFQEILANNLSLLNLIDSKFSVLSNKLAKFYGFPNKDLRQQPKHYDLPENSRRGGIMTMSAVLAVSSLPNRTSPVLRGKWLLDAVLGTPAPPPPPNVPELQDNKAGAPPKTLRERLETHRQNPVCASCHNRIDPLGFGLENYDVLGRWRTEDSGKPIDSKGVLPDGSEFDGPDQLKALVLKKKELFLRNLTSKLLGYALGRGLTLEESCTVDQIIEKLEKTDYSAHTLVNEIVLSIPFRYKAGTVANLPVQYTETSNRD
ncbi:MAG: DUF1592 domain-containing protein [Acidobacteria bacterium]|nr:DUF1592 domain-containing protein [Acidobacteriota bacterium]